jgi:putative ATP-dependent endonuclease of the OLD family
MKPAIVKVKMCNFKRFRSYEIELDEGLNIIVGDNEAGKSSVLVAADLVISGSRSKVESIGLDNLFNRDVIQEFLASAKDYADLPELYVEVYLNERNNPDVNGSVNSENRVCDGLRMICTPNDELGADIREILSQDQSIFPFEFYNVEFKTFDGRLYSGYKKYAKHLFVDNSLVSNDYATREYIKDMYNSQVAGMAERVKHQSEYRRHKDMFTSTALVELNSRLPDYKFTVKTSQRTNLDTDLTIAEDDINIDHRGRGRQVFIKTDFALRDEGNLDLVLIEEPENHLSHINTQKLIDRICSTDDKQIIVSTHNDLISARLDLRKCALIAGTAEKPLRLKDLSQPTAEFFIKAPDNNILEFILSKKALLVEGDAEYILMNDFYEMKTGHKPQADGVRIIAINGTGFKRYLEVAKILNIKTAVIRDNDGNFQANCVDNYIAYSGDNNKIFADQDNSVTTFEVALYKDNKSDCDSLFSTGRRTLTVQEYMLANKAEAAFALLENKAGQLTIPAYIGDAIEWVRE